MHIKRFVAVKAHAAFVICVFHSLRGDPRFNRFVARKMVLDRIPTGWYFPYQLVGIFMTTAETRHESKRKLLDAACLLYTSIEPARTVAFKIFVFIHTPGVPIRFEEISASLSQSHSANWVD